ncbi:MAG: ATP-grasp domain-containing protein, partial [Sphingomicrobium sp.]
ELGPRGGSYLLEGSVAFRRELSIVAARDLEGRTVHYPLAENVHRDGILRTSRAPADVTSGLEADARRIADLVLHGLEHVGVLAIELFDTVDGLLVNEVAPRVHNSGHWTIEGAVTSQFEQHIRAVCGLPLGDPALTGARVTMDNLIGDEIDQWPALVTEPGAHVHDYDKGDARPGRKMGHVTRVVR